MGSELLAAVALDAGRIFTVDGDKQMQSITCNICQLNN